MSKLIQQYDSKKNKYQNSLQLVEQLLVSLMKANNINYHTISGRLKTRESLEGKIIRKNEKYSDLSEITDLVGLRIITYTEDEIDRVRDLISREFKVDIENSVDKREKEPNEFGYSSLHLIVNLSDERKGLTEYYEVSGLKFEIQIRTILQHAWAEIEHDIGYKSKTGIPNQMKRSFSRIASLLELADIEFVKILEETLKYGNEVDHNLMASSGEIDMDIDLITLRSFLKNTELVRTLDNEIANLLNYSLEERNSNEELSRLIEKLDYFSIKKINLLNQKLLEYKPKIIEIARRMSREADEIYFDEVNTVFYGISIFYLFYAILSDSNKYEDIYNYLEDFSIGHDYTNDTISFQKIFKALE